VGGLTHHLHVAQQGLLCAVGQWAFCATPSVLARCSLSTHSQSPVTVCGVTAQSPWRFVKGVHRRSVCHAPARVNCCEVLPFLQAAQHSMHSSDQGRYDCNVRPCCACCAVAGRVLWAMLCCACVLL
jgi:hypothetical protein